MGIVCIGPATITFAVGYIVGRYIRALTLLRMFGVPDRLACLAEPNRCVSESSVKKQIFLDFEEIFLSRQCILQAYMDKFGSAVVMRFFHHHRMVV